MEQIYYTQCPVGYGLGASNGYQIKRVSAGYPISGDFRHLGLKAFASPGSKALAPTTLRYRRDGEAAEVIRLTPRTQEYQTERGLWGRPGGVFAHGIRLDRAELDAIKGWPAGLLDAPIWRTGDPEPTRGRLPEPVVVGRESLAPSPTFADVAPIARGLDPDWLARAWTALARCVRDGRTLFLVDEPDRLAPLIALLTFALPMPLRGWLTFSTFHDRPEELPGYRVQGASASGRPNRPALLSQGFIADRATSTIEPAIQPAGWASTLARWFVEADAIAEADWSSLEARSAEVRWPGSVEATWTDEWLDPLVDLDRAIRDRAAPESESAWDRARQFATWAGASGLGKDWLRTRGPAWWEAAAAAVDAGERPRGDAGRRAFVAHATLRDAWTIDGAGAWGRAFGAWFGDAGADDRERSATRLLAASPSPARPAFARSMLAALPAGVASGLLDRLRSNPAFDRALILPLEVEAAARLVAGDPPDPPLGLSKLLAEAKALPGVLVASLDAVASVAHETPAAFHRLARGASSAFAPEDRQVVGQEALSWSLRQGEWAAGWLAPTIRPILAGEDVVEAIEAIRQQVDLDDRAGLARAMVGVATDPALPDESYRLIIERLLLPLAPRPHDPSWAETYLERTRSDWELIRRAFAGDVRGRELLRWFTASAAAGELSKVSLERLRKLKKFAQSLASREARTLPGTPLPDAEPAERGPILRRMVDDLGGRESDGLAYVLDACRASWPDAFLAGASGLEGVAEVLAELVPIGRRSPEVWFAEVESILDRLGLTAPGTDRGFESDGLASQMVAAADPSLSPAGWSLRQYLLDDDRAWRVLACDLARSLSEDLDGGVAEVANRWDSKLSKGSRPERFWELLLNVADDAGRAEILFARVDELKSLGPIAWWVHPLHEGATDDIREAFALTAPIRPMAGGVLGRMRPWLLGAVRPSAKGQPPRPISDRASDRWQCLEALTLMRPTGQDAATTWQNLFDWEKKNLPLRSLPLDDRYTFVAWLIFWLDASEEHQVARLAAWLHRAGIRDHDRISRWADEIAGAVEVDDLHRIGRARLVGELGREIRTLQMEAGRRQG